MTAPSEDRLIYDWAVAGGAAFTLTVNGTGFLQRHSPVRAY